MKCQIHVLSLIMLIIVFLSLSASPVYSQNIISNNISIFRAFANGIYWLKHYYYEISSRNLGYYSEKQTDLAKRKMKHEEYLYKIGQSSNRDVLLLRKEYLDVRLHNLSIILEYNKLLADYYLNQGSIMDYY